MMSHWLTLWFLVAAACIVRNVTINGQPPPGSLLYKDGEDRSHWEAHDIRHRVKEHAKRPHQPIPVADQEKYKHIMFGTLRRGKLRR